MSWYTLFKPIYLISNIIGIWPIKIKAHKHNFNFSKKKFNISDKLQTFLLTFVCISGIVAYILSNHRTPMIQAYQDLVDNQNRLINKILLYMAECSGYLIILITYINQYYISNDAKTSLEMTVRIESKLKQYNSFILYKDKKLYFYATFIFFIDICLKFYDTFNLVYNKYIPFHGIYEHIIRYLCIAFMDLIILQWICFMELVKLYLNELTNLLKYIKVNQYWIMDDFCKLKRHKKKCKQILNDVSNIYDELYFMSNKINVTYRFPFLVIIPVCFIIATVTIFSMCKIIKKGDYINPFMSVIYMSSILRMAAIILSPISVTKLNEKFIAVLHSLDITKENEGLSKLVML